LISFSHTHTRHQVPRSCSLPFSRSASLPGPRPRIDRFSRTLKPPNKRSRAIIQPNATYLSQTVSLYIYLYIYIFLHLSHT
jgi:hypothetical protein